MYKEIQVGELIIFERTAPATWSTGVSLVHSNLSHPDRLGEFGLDVDGQSVVV